jgi:hypothetical protein
MQIYFYWIRVYITHYFKCWLGYHDIQQLSFLSIEQFAIQSSTIFIFALVGFSLSVVLLCLMYYLLKYQISERR